MKTNKKSVFSSFINTITGKNVWGVFVLSMVLYYIVHTYFYYKVYDFFPFTRLFLLKSLIVLVMIFPVSALLHVFFVNRFVAFLYYIGSMWFGISMITAFIFLITDAIIYCGDFFNFYVDKQILGISALVAIAVISSHSIVNAKKINIKFVKVPIKNLPKHLDGFKIVQLSDVHAGIIYDTEDLAEIVDMTNNLNPDIVAITGDLFDGTGKMSRELIEPIGKLTPKYNTFFVNGNHESYANRKVDVDKVVKSLGVKILDGDVCDVNGLLVMGVSTTNGGEVLFNKKSLLSIKNKLTPGKPIVFLNHVPNGIKFASDLGVSLQLSGHTHGGQIYPFRHVMKPVFRKNYGLYKVKNMYLYVSSGAGTWGPKMRWFSNSEIVSITLISDNSLLKKKVGMTRKMMSKLNDKRKAIVQGIKNKF